MESNLELVEGVKDSENRPWIYKLKSEKKENTLLSDNYIS